MRVEEIHSLDDPRVADYRDVKDADLLEKSNLFMTEGRLGVRRLIADSRFRARSVFVTKAALLGLSDVFTELGDETRIYLASQKLLGEVVGYNMHRGCLAAAERGAPLSADEILARISPHPSTADAHLRTLTRGTQGRCGRAESRRRAERGGPGFARAGTTRPGVRLLDVPTGTPPGGALRKESEYPEISRQSANLNALATRRGEKGGLARCATGRRLLVVLEDVTNPDNVGSVFRNARAFGADGVFLTPRCTDPLYRKAVRVSMGGTLQLPFAQVESCARAFEALRTAGFAVVAFTPEPAAQPLEEAALHLACTERVALAFGTEEAGLSAAALAAADVRARIAMAPGVDSLNVATASGIALHRFAKLAGAG